MIYFSCYLYQNIISKGKIFSSQGNLFLSVSRISAFMDINSISVINCEILLALTFACLLTFCHKNVYFYAFKYIYIFPHAL